VERNAEPEISIDFSDTEDNSAPRKIAPPPVETQEKDSQNMPKSEVNELPDWAM
jgi:hypothetical protein